MQDSQGIDEARAEDRERGATAYSASQQGNSGGGEGTGAKGNGD